MSIYSSISEKEKFSTVQSDPSLGKVFLCPFNSYHKLPDARKLSFHIGRCGDRKGKDVYICKHNTSHIYIDVQRLIDHEITYVTYPYYL